MNLSEKMADRTIYSEYGALIKPGELYFETELHGRDANLTLRETENLLGFRDVSTQERKELAGKGKALSDGSFPIASCSDAANAIRAIGRANPSDRGKVRAHIRRRVAALDCSGSIFENWGGS